MYKKVIYTVLFLVALSVSGEAQWAQKFYRDVPPVKMEEPLGVMVGSLSADNPFISISISDVGLYTGHICPGVAAGFKATALALKSLYGDKTPVRGEIRVAINKPSDLLDVVSYITGARAFYGRDEVNHNDIVVDKTLGGGKGKIILLFQRKDTGKSVKVIFDKTKLFKPMMMKNIKRMKKKVMEGRASKKQKKRLETNLQKKVKQILFNLPEGVITVEDIKDYKFPEVK